MKELINGKRIILQRLSCDMETARTIFFVIDKCREEFLPWLAWVKNTNSAMDTLKFLELSDNDWKNRSQFNYGIYLENKFIGLIGAVRLAWEHKRGEIGYWLDTDYTGNGYMTEAIQLIEKELFENAFNRIEIYTDVLNIKSAKLPRALGYTHEGILRQHTYSEFNQCFCDQNVFSKLKSQIISDKL